jgi:hypothetical protein
MLNVQTVVSVTEKVANANVSMDILVMHAVELHAQMTAVAMVLVKLLLNLVTNLKQPHMKVLLMNGTTNWGRKLILVYYLV